MPATSSPALTRSSNEWRGISATGPKADMSAFVAHLPLTRSGKSNLSAKRLLLNPPLRLEPAANGFPFNA
jgi:hypothetical protein